MMSSNLSCPTKFMKIELIPLIDACDFPTAVEDELAGFEVSTHYQCDIIGVEFDGGYPKLEAWLVETYGEEIKQYTQFAILAT